MRVLLFAALIMMLSACALVAPGLVANTAGLMGDDAMIGERSVPENSTTTSNKVDSRHYWKGVVELDHDHNILLLPQNSKGKTGITPFVLSISFQTYGADRSDQWRLSPMKIRLNLNGQVVAPTAFKIEPHFYCITGAKTAPTEIYSHDEEIILNREKLSNWTPCVSLLFSTATPSADNRFILSLPRIAEGQQLYDLPPISFVSHYGI